MKNLLFAALLLGCLIGIIHANWREEFEFNDSNENCWRCSPGKACERCNNKIFPHVDLPDISDICITPNCNDLRNSGHLSALIPHVNTRLFYQCIPNPNNPSEWTAAIRECPCDTVFSFVNQRCDWPWEWEPFCRNLMLEVEACPGPTEDPIETPSPTDPPTDGPTDAPSTPSPCVCIPWWPCPCNPCWHMPCNSCGGCVVGGGMGMWG